MSWPPTHYKTKVIDRVFMNRTYIYTNQGFRRKGLWHPTGTKWTEGVCLLEFKRTCNGNTKQRKTKETDLQSHRIHVLVQDTDLAYRPRIVYSDARIISAGRWEESGGECVDQVVRGCFNNGTCIAPDTCQCAPGWIGADCTIPTCTQTCFNLGNCTYPNTCTCERGWTGHDCNTPICAQDCLNGGYCVAPDTCHCLQWPNAFIDGRLNGGTPLFQDLHGNPQLTGWTGYDCSTPICVQAETFRVNIKLPLAKLNFPELNIPLDLIGETDLNSNVYGSLNIPAYMADFYRLGGRGADGLMSCSGVRCPHYDLYVTGNAGNSFQTGCGYDPYDTGCCVSYGSELVCYYCDHDDKVTTAHTFECTGPLKTINATFANITNNANMTQFLDLFGNVRLCGAYHSPRSHDLSKPYVNQDYGVARYFINPNAHTKGQIRYSSQNYNAKYTSNRFLCHVNNWYHGSFNTSLFINSYNMTDNAERKIRNNYVNIHFNSKLLKWVDQGLISGEGVYACYNGGSCLGPDYCSCTDGYEGFDCRTPLCRHLQVTGLVSSCQNGGVCVSRDSCYCIQNQSVLWKVYPDAPRANTGKNRFISVYPIEYFVFIYT